MIFDSLIYLICILIILWYIKEAWNNSTRVKEDFSEITSNGFYPSNMADYTDNYLEPPITKLDTSFMEGERPIHYAMENLEDPYPNPGLSKELPFDYANDAKYQKEPIEWNCQRDWLECNVSDMPSYWDKRK